jgi:hypothetical protein
MVKPRDDDTSHSFQMGQIYKHTKILAKLPNKYILYRNPRSCTEDKRPPTLAACNQFVELPNQKNTKCTRKYKQCQMIDFVLEYGSSTLFLDMIPKECELYQKLSNTRRILSIPKMEKNLIFRCWRSTNFTFISCNVSSLYNPCERMSMYVDRIVLLILKNCLQSLAD